MSISTGNASTIYHDTRDTGWNILLKLLIGILIGIQFVRHVLSKLLTRGYIKLDFRCSLCVIVMIVSIHSECMFRNSFVKSSRYIVSG